MVPKDLLPSYPLAGTIQYRRWGKPTVSAPAPLVADAQIVLLFRSRRKCACSGISLVGAGSSGPSCGDCHSGPSGTPGPTKNTSPSVFSVATAALVGHHVRFSAAPSVIAIGEGLDSPVPDCCKQHLLRRVTFLCEKVTKTHLGTHGP